MLPLGMFLAFVGVLGIAGFLVQKYKSGRIGTTPFVKTGDAASRGDAVAGDKKAISVEGAVVAPAMVTAPVTRTDALFYHLRVVAKWKVGDQTRSQEVANEKNAAVFSLDDGSGPVGIDATKGGDFDLKQTFKKTKGLGIVSVFTGDGIAFGDHGFKVIPGQKINGIKIPDNAEYEVTEECLLPASRLYACGRFEGGKVASPSWASLMLSQKSRDELLSATMKTANIAKFVGIGGLGLGGVLMVLGLVLGGGKGGAGPAEAPAAIEDAAPAAADAPTPPPAAAPAEAAPASPAAPPSAPPAPSASPAAAPSAPAAGPASGGGGAARPGVPGGGGKAGKAKFGGKAKGG